jgi:hypothetical protein
VKAVKDRLSRRLFPAVLLLALSLGGCGIEGTPIPPENVPPETPLEAPAKKTAPPQTPAGPQKGGGGMDQEEPDGGFPDK